MKIIDKLKGKEKSNEIISAIKEMEKESQDHSPVGSPDHWESKGITKKRLSFTDALTKARAQIDVACFSQTDKAFANEVLANIAEAYMMYDSAPVKIGGEQIDGYIIKQVFEQLTEDHIQLVIDNYKKIDYFITYKKAYIRTALYNSVFELEAHYTNKVNTDLHIN